MHDSYVIARRDPPPLHLVQPHTDLELRQRQAGQLPHRAPPAVHHRRSGVSAAGERDREDLQIPGLGAEVELGFHLSKMSTPECEVSL